MATLSTSATSSNTTGSTGDWYDNTWNQQYTNNPISWKQIQDAMKQVTQPIYNQPTYTQSMSTEQLLVDITKKIDALAETVNTLCEVMRIVLEARTKQLEQPHE